MPPRPDSPASMPTRRNTSSSGAPKRSATRLDMMPASTSTAPNRMVMLTVSSDAMGALHHSWRRDAERNDKDVACSSSPHDDRQRCAGHHALLAMTGWP